MKKVVLTLCLAVAAIACSETPAAPEGNGGKTPVDITTVQQDVLQGNLYYTSTLSISPYPCNPCNWTPAKGYGTFGYQNGWIYTYNRERYDGGLMRCGMYMEEVFAQPPQYLWDYVGSSSQWMARSKASGPGGSSWCALNSDYVTHWVEDGQYKVWMTPYTSAYGLESVRGYEEWSLTSSVVSISPIPVYQAW